MIKQSKPKIENPKTPLLDRILEHYNLAWYSKIPFMQEWLKIIYYANGEQEIEVDENLRVHSLQESKKYIENRFAQSLRIITSKMIAKLPMPIITPASATQEDYRIAKITSLLLKWLWEQLDVQYTVNPEIAKWLTLTGNICVKCIWINRDNFDKTNIPDDIKFQINSISESNIPGYPFIYAVTPFNIMVAPYALNFDESPWYIEVHTFYKDVFKERFGKKAFDKESGNIEQKYVFFDTQDDGSLSLIKSSDIIPVYECYYKPSKEFPNGEYILATNNQILHYNNTERFIIPYAFATDVKLKSQIWGTSILKDSIPLQDRINELEDDVSKHVKYLVNPPIAVPDQSTIEEDIIDPGELVRFDVQSGIPQYMLQNNGVMGLLQILDRTRMILPDILGIHDVSHGSVPRNLESGRALQFLAEQDVTKLGVINHAFVKILKKLGVLLLKTWKINMPYHISLAICGKEFTPEFVEFYSSDINSFNIIFEGGSQLMVNEAWRRQQALEMLQYGAINQQEYRQIVELDVRAIEDYEDYYYANEENFLLMEMVETNQIPVPSWWENHNLHYKLHIVFMKSKEFRMLPIAIKKAFEQHLQIHVGFIQQQQQQMLQNSGKQPQKKQPPNINKAEETELSKIGQ